MVKIVLVEDDHTIAEPLTRALLREGYDVEWKDTGHDGVVAAASVDLVILDLGLPDIDGIEVARRVREQGLSVPILMLTARADEVDLVVGLDAGADDYVTKPFRLAELLARVRALLRRRSSIDAGQELRGGPVRIDLKAHQAFVHEEEVHLSSKEYLLLKLLLENAGNVVTREVILREVWGDPKTSSKTLDMHISSLRRKLGDDAAEPKFITTVRGFGFRFENLG